MTTYAGKNIDDATSAMISMGLGYNDMVDYSEDVYWRYGPEHIIERAREMQEENPDKEVWVSFFHDLDGDNFVPITEGPIRDEPVTHFVVDERGNLRPFTGVAE